MLGTAGRLTTIGAREGSGSAFLGIVVRGIVSKAYGFFAAQSFGGHTLLVRSGIIPSTKPGGIGERR
jgi:hypothetical protein